MSTRTRARVHAALPSLKPEAFPGFGEAAPLDIPALSPKAVEQLAGLVSSSDFDAWSRALARVGSCAHPIRLRGHSETIDTATGEIRLYSSEEEPLGVTHVRCGNRRASECPDCYEYASHVVWQWWAPDLWCRFTIALRRLVAKTLGIPASRLPEVATVQYAKVAEYQRRGLVHFHALIRLDGRPVRRLALRASWAKHKARRCESVSAGC